MTDVLIFFGVSVLVLVGGLYAFSKIVERKMYKWIQTWDRVWGIDLEVRIKALKHIKEWLQIGYITPKLFGFKQWYKDVYWHACKIHDPTFPTRMWMRYELEDMLYAAALKEILYGDGTGEPLTGIFNESEGDKK